MKRSQRLFLRSRHAGWLSAAVLMVSAAIVCGVPMAILSGDRHPGGMVLAVAMGALALAGFAAGFHLAAEAIRLSRLGYMETRWEWEREVRPKL